MAKLLKKPRGFKRILDFYLLFVNFVPVFFTPSSEDEDDFDRIVAPGPGPVPNDRF